MSSVVPRDPLIGQTVDNRYKIIALIARGGMAKVYKSEQIHLSRTVAIKVLDPKHVGADDPEFQKRFELEAQMTSQLNHPNTVTIHDYGFNAEKHFYYFVMEFIKGKTLRRAMKEEGAFTIERSLHIGRQVARSVRQAHSVGVIHRDLKPSNILLTTHDQDTNYIKVVDFGLLKLKKESAVTDEKTEATLMGSPRYMSPEQIKRLPVDHRSDIYSLGVNMYQMLTGRPPFTGSSAVQILMGHLNQLPPPFAKVSDKLMIPKAVEEFALRCLRKNPDERPRDMDEVIETLSELIKIDKKPGAYTSIPVTKQVDVISSGRDEERAEEDREKVPEEPPSSPPAWSDTVTESPFYEPQQDGGVASIPIDVAQPVSQRKFSPMLLVIFGLAVIFLGALVTLGVLLFGSKTGFKSTAGGGKDKGGQQTKVIETPPLVPTDDASAASEGETTGGEVNIYKLKFSTEPSEAHIFEGENALCVTPCDVEWVVTEGKQEETRSFAVVKEGYEPVEIKQKTPNSDVDIGIPLSPIEVKDAFKKPKEWKGPGQKVKKPEKTDQGTKEKGKEGLKLIHEYPDA